MFDLETPIMRSIRLELSKYGIVHRLQSGTFFTQQGSRIKIGIEGLPDLLFVGDNGFVAWIEVKRPKGAHRDKQEKYIALMKQMGHCAGFVESVDDALKLIGK